MWRINECIHITLHCIILADREALIAEAIAEAKEHGRQQSIAREASIQALKDGRRLSSGQVVGRLFKKATKSARQQGETRVMFEDMVRRAERKLAEAERKAAGVQSADERAEALARELFHRPGSMLTKEELARMSQEASCQEVRPFPVCKFPRDWIYRTIDGTCNNLENPLFGASNTQFTRIAPAEYADGIASLRGGLQARKTELALPDPFLPPTPSARIISKTIIFRNESAVESPFTHILMQWGQFLDHDLDLSPELEAVCEGCEFTELCEPIRVLDGDPAFGKGTRQNGDCLRFARSLPACPLDQPGTLPERQQLNAITSYIDGSQVYGSNDRVANAVRAFQDGLLREGKNFPGDKPALPVDKDDIVACLNANGCFLAGDVRVNEQISLTIMHTLWFREHNRIARELKKINPFWNDERLFQEARRIVGALLQKITYYDYLPKVMGPSTFNDLIGPFIEYDPRIDAGVPNAFATAAYRYGHSLVRPEFARLGSDYRPLPKGSLNLVDAFFNPIQFKLSMGTDPILRGLVTENSNRADSFLNFVLTTMLFANETEGIAGMDLASLNIQRGRDHGLPPFLTWVNHCATRFPNLQRGGQFQKNLDLIRFLELYGNLDTVDLWMGGLAEERLEDSFLGHTFACIFGITFANVRDGDRFWYEKSGVFTSRQLSEIKKGTLSRVICGNSDNIDEIQPDAFVNNQSRVSCTGIPSVNLQEWREDGCFARVQVMRINEALEVSLFSRAIHKPTVSSFTQVFNASFDNQFQCMPVACPSYWKGTIVFMDTNMPTAIQITPNSNLPRNKLRTSNSYYAFWPKTVFKRRASGVFKSQSQCEDPGNDYVALTISTGVDVQQDDSDMNDNMKEFDTLFEDDDTDKPSDQEGVEDEDTDEDLMSQLEEALADLSL